AALTLMVGGAMSGYCARGSIGMAKAPTRVMKTETTIAKIGRSMKKREIFMDQVPALEPPPQPALAAKVADEAMGAVVTGACALTSSALMVPFWAVTFWPGRAR